MNPVQQQQYECIEQSEGFYPCMASSLSSSKGKLNLAIVYSLLLTQHYIH